MISWGIYWRSRPACTKTTGKIATILPRQRTKTRTKKCTLQTITKAATTTTTTTTTSMMHGNRRMGTTTTTMSMDQASTANPTGERASSQTPGSRSLTTSRTIGITATNTEIMGIMGMGTRTTTGMGGLGTRTWASTCDIWLHPNSLLLKCSFR